MRILAINVHTNEKREFQSQKEAAVFSGISSATMSVYVKHGTIDRNGWQYQETSVPEENLPRYLRYYYRKKEEKQLMRFVADSINDSDREKYHIIKYKKNAANVCLTPCPFMLSPKPTVGSTKCQSCPSFKAIDRKTLEVACARRLFA